MLHTIGDPRPLEYWVHRLFPGAQIRHRGDKVQIIEKVDTDIDTHECEIGPQLTEPELLIWLDGIETATRSGVGHDLIEQAGWVLPDEESIPDQAFFLDDKRNG